jgi:hypothetical protein
MTSYSHFLVAAEKQEECKCNNTVPARRESHRASPGVGVSSNNNKQKRKEEDGRPIDQEDTQATKSQ